MEKRLEDIKRNIEQKEKTIVADTIPSIARLVSDSKWLIDRVEQLEKQLDAVNQALKDAKGEPSLTSDGLIAWLYSTLPFLNEE